MSIFPLKSTSTYIKAYFAALEQFQKHGHTTEGNTRSAFADLLKRACGPYGWHLVEEFPFKGTKKQPLRADGALIDQLTLQHGIWEAKDNDDDLEKEVRSKVAKGYPLTNTLFQSPDRAILYQDSRIAFDKPIDTADNLVEVLQLFFDHQIVPGVDWQKVIKDFGQQIPSIAGGIDELLNREHHSNSNFRERFAAFAELCRVSINPDLSDEAIRKMLVQHLLTERIFRKVFNNQEFLQRNVIAVEIEKVIRSITDKHFSRDQFLKSLDHFYIPLEKAAEQQEDYTEKQHFLNAVYEKFFQSFDPKQADTMGIVYTPQPIVDFMVRSVEEILKQEFGKSLSDSGVHILDPFTGTGNFITRIMQEIKRSALPQKYAEELHCNEVMLLPYYIASMNIEHEYMERSGQYSPFEGICLVDTFELSEFGQQSFAFTSTNTERVRKQKKQPIFVVIGNPPYNMGQVNENDQNKNRKYKHWDNRIKDTYTKDSKATLRNKLSDPYVKAFRWASDRIRNGGIIAYVTNNSFVDQIAFDGMRHHLARDFSKLYILDLGGNVRQNPKLSGTTHNVFGIQVGVAISFLVKGINHLDDGDVLYARMPENWKRGQKYDQLDTWNTVFTPSWNQLKPDVKHTWLTLGQEASYEELVSLGDKSLKGSDDAKAVFGLFSLGVVSSRDAFVYNESRTSLEESMLSSVEKYNEALAKVKYLKDRSKKVQQIVTQEDAAIKWSRQTIRSLSFAEQTTFSESYVRECLYRPYRKLFHYFDDFWNEELYQLPSFYPSYDGSVLRNRAICLAQNAVEGRFHVLATDVTPDFHLTGDSQVYAFYTYEKNGTNRRENITDWVLSEFRTYYSDNSITKWDIFHATYAILHHPEYRTRYAANLKRELPRIPFPPDVHAFAAAGKRLMELHIDYEQQPEYPLEQVEDPKADIDFRVTRMKLSKDKTELRYNDFLTLRGIPPSVYDYRLGNRSALEWIIDQYQVTTDKRSGIVNDPNREDDPGTENNPDRNSLYILRLIGQVITVSLETNAIIAALPTLGLPDPEPAQTASHTGPEA